MGTERGTPEAPRRSSIDTIAELDRLAARSSAQMAAENFPVALRILPSRIRDALSRTYTYARFVDDVGDEAAGDRCALLDVVAGDVRRLSSGTARLAPVAGLIEVVRTYDLPLDPLLDLVEANRRDQRVTRYGDFAELADYCRCSANPVGRIVLRLADADRGPGAETTLRLSDTVCTALQVLEHCQDVGEDARRRRVYLTADELDAAGVRDQDLTAGTTSPALRTAVARHVDRASRMLDEGRTLPRRLHGWARFAVAGYLAGGLATADALRQHDYDVLGRAITPGKAGTARHLAAVLVRPRSTVRP